MRLIEAESLKETMAVTLKILRLIFREKDQEEHLISAFLTVGKMVDACPTIDAVSVVRCKDCKWSFKYMDGSYECGLHEFFQVEPNPEGFCAWGERKDNETY